MPARDPSISILINKSHRRLIKNSKKITVEFFRSAVRCRALVRRAHSQYCHCACPPQAPPSGPPWVQLMQLRSGVLTEP